MSQPTPQELFEQRYITSSEICERLRVNRTQLFHRRQRKQLPGEITIKNQNIMLWERDFIEPFLTEWEVSLNNKRTARA